MAHDDEPKGPPLPITYRTLEFRKYTTSERFAVQLVLPDVRYNDITSGELEELEDCVFEFAEMIRATQAERRRIHAEKNPAS